ncbi:MAG: CapA family protein [Ruminococcaceae bacterium]|nr:CapA family protein [Oscillospiraceae bacterium]
MKRYLSLILAVIFIISLTSCEKIGKNDLDGAADYVDLTTDAAKEPEDTEPPLEDDVISNELSEQRTTFLAVGDNIMYHCNFTDARNRANEEYPDYNFMPIYEELADEISAADIAYINQETVMAGEEYGYKDYPCFNTPRNLGDQLIELGFDVFNIATNHMLDMGSSGLEDTIEYWNSKKEVTMIGGYENEEAYLEPCIIESDGISMALLSYTYGTNGISPSAYSEAVVPYIDEDTIREDIRRVRDLADSVIVSIHWGVENVYSPNTEQQSLAQMMCDEGVDVIIGTHPHVIQPVEWISSDNGNKTLCIYSLGNFVATMTQPGNMVGGMASFELVKKGDDITVENVIFEPVIHHFGPSYYNSRLYYLSDYTDELASQLGRDCYGIRTSYDALCKIVTDTIDDEFLPDYLTKSEEQ